MDFTLITEARVAKFFWELPQGSSAWYAERSGIPTASMFDQVLTPKRMELSASRKKYAARLIAERLLNWQSDSLDKIQHIADGKANEHYAVGSLEDIYDIKTTPIGFATTDDGRFGASPDRVAQISSDRS